MRAFGLSTVIGGLLLLANLAACGFSDIYGYTVCYDEQNNEVPCCGKYPNHRPCPPDAGADAASDASDDGESDASIDDGGPPAAICPWPCTPVGGGGFDPFPSYVWMGAETASPPQLLNGFAWTSWIDVTFAEPICPTCSCAAPTAPESGCILPTVWSAESTTCQDASSSTITPFDAPLDWGGICTSTNPIAAGLMCDGAPCVKSLVVQPPTIAPCIAEPSMPPEGQTLPPPTRTKVVEYVGGIFPGTCEAARNCIEPPPTGYKICFVASGPDAVASCPEGWTDRYTGWRDVSDTRVCSPCTCGSPVGASCEVLATVYADDACGNLRGSLVLPSNEGAKCTDLPVGTALGSKMVELLSYQAGACAASTSEVIGAITTERPVTYCCLPSPEMPK